MPALVVSNQMEEDTASRLLKQAASSKSTILSRKIKFVAALKNPSMSISSSTASSISYSSLTLNKGSQDGSKESLANLVEHNLVWQKSAPVGPGLVNLGNTCFMNSVLQCLTYTPPLTQYLLSHPHDCHHQPSCTLHAMEWHVKRSMGQSRDHASSSAFCPKPILSKMKLIAKHFRLGRQEDSHEFLLHLLEAMEKGCARKLTSSPKSKEKNVIQEVFGGKLQSQVKCLNCKKESNTMDPVMDLCLEIKHCDSIEKALGLFTKKESLTGRNRYKCEGYANSNYVLDLSLDSNVFWHRCKKLVDAQKQITIHDSPPVLSIQLKRFDFLGMHGSKINRHIRFNEKLDLSLFMSHKEVCRDCISGNS